MNESPVFSRTSSYRTLIRLLRTNAQDTGLFKAHFLKLKESTLAFNVNYLLKTSTQNGYRRFPLIFFALNYNNMNVLRFLLKQGANPNVVLDSIEPIPQDRTILHEAVRRGNEEAVRLLLKFHANPNVYQSASEEIHLAGASPLHYAVAQNYPVMVNLLLFCKANPNAKLAETDKEWPGATPIFFAYQENKIEIISLLLAHGAHWHAVIAYPSIRFQYTSHQLITQGATPLHLAAFFGELDVMKTLLEAGASPYSYYLCKGGGYTPLYHAIIGNQRPAVELLLQSGASPDLVHYHSLGGKTSSALHIFSSQYFGDENEAGEIVATLLDWGANPNLQHQGVLNIYPLDYVYDSYLKTLYLLSYGADPFLILHRFDYFQNKVRILIESYQELLLIPSFRRDEQSLFIATQWIHTFNNLIGNSIFPSLKQLAIWSLLASEHSDYPMKQKTLPMSKMSESDYLFFRTKPIVELSKKYQEPALPKL